VKTESEQRLGSAAMSFDRNGMQRAMATPVLTVSATGPGGAGARPDHPISGHSRLANGCFWIEQQMSQSARAA
jgi:hypothetical protein